MLISTSLGGINPQAFKFCFVPTDQKAVSPYFPPSKQGVDVEITKTLKFLLFELLVHNRM
jgi:hypothetical protein